MELSSPTIGNRTISREMQTNGRINSLFDMIIRTEGIELTDDLKKAITRKIGRVRQYAPRAFRARVQIQREHSKSFTHQYRVAVQYELPGRDIVAEHTEREVLPALDVVSEKIERRLRKRKTAVLAARTARRGRPRRIADLCNQYEPYPLERT